MVRLNRLGLRCKELGQYEQGRDYYRRALVLIGGDRGSDRSAVATLYHNLARLEHGLGDFASAVVLARRGIAIRLARRDDDPRDVASDLTALAAILDALGDAVAAERETAFGLGDLGALCVARGRYRRGMRLLRRSITLEEAQPGGADPALAVTLNNFALAFELACRGNSARAARPSLRSKRGRRG